MNRNAKIGLVGILLLSTMITAIFINKAGTGGNSTKVGTGDNSTITPSYQQIPQSKPKPIFFQIEPGTPTSCGATCRQTTATLTNIGYETAKNVNINLNVNNKAGKNVYSYQESLGDIKSGQTRSEALTINVNCGILGYDCWNYMPLTLIVEVSWDGGSQPFTQQFSG